MLLTWMRASFFVIPPISLIVPLPLPAYLFDTVMVEEFDDALSGLIVSAL